MEKAIEKVNVLNPIAMRNTVGQELCEMMNAHGIDNAAERMGIPNLEKKEKLTDKQIARACEILQMDDVLRNFLYDFQDEYLREKARCEEVFLKEKKSFTKLKTILPLLRGEFSNGKDRLDDILDFFGKDTVEEVFTDSEKAAALFRKQNNVAVDPIHLKAWLRRGELDFAKMQLPEYNEIALKQWLDARQWEQKIEDASYYKQLPALLAPFGVGVVLVPFLPKTVYGAVRWIDEKPLVEISDRNQDLATCWVTLFHELGHVLLHRATEIFEGEINEPQTKTSDMEKEANDFANHYLFGGDTLRRSVFSRKRTGTNMTAAALSEEFHVNRLLTSYWLRKAQINPSFQKRIHIDFVEDYQG